MALISFDLDGVLQRSPWHSYRPDGVYGHIKRELARELGDPDVEAAEERIFRMIMGEYLARLERGQLVDAHNWDDIVTVVADRLGCKNTLDCKALVAEYCERPGLIWLYPGAAECLDGLSADGHTLVAVTNGFRAYQEPVLRKLGIFHRFTALITPDAAGFAKPHPGIFKVAEGFGGRPRIHVGDVLTHDVAGAKRAGWSAIYVVQAGAPGATELPPDLAALPPQMRPAAASDWLASRLQRDRRWYPHPPADLADCRPEAIVTSLSEIPAAVAALTP